MASNLSDTVLKVFSTRDCTVWWRAGGIIAEDLYNWDWEMAHIGMRGVYMAAEPRTSL